MRNILLLLLVLVTLRLDAQMDARHTRIDSAQALAGTITAADLQKHLTILAADDMEGRETGQPGQKKAADYIANEFARLGLPRIGDENSYFQRISFISDSWTNIRFGINGEDLVHLRDFYSLPRQNASRTTVTPSEVIFLGYGIESDRYNDYRRADVTGKTILILSGEPFDRKGNSLVSGQAQPSEWSEQIRLKLQAARRHGVATVIFIDADYRENIPTARKEILDSGLRMAWSENPEENYANSVFISTETARKLLGGAYNDVVKARKKLQKSGKLKPVTIPVSGFSLTQEKSSHELLGENVMGYIEGSDPALKQELVIVSAHYDHIGRRGDIIFNGADDNGSGTSTLLELTEALVEAKANGTGPRRSVLVLLVSGEEKGLLGSQYYVEYPVFPLERTIANVNVDMVGRVDEKHAENPNYIYVIGSDRLSTDLHRINETANATYTQLELDYTYNEESDPNRYYYRSDHYNFAERGIPAIFYFNGTHEDYHRETDTVEKINFTKMEKIGRLVFHTVWELANRSERIRVDVPQQGR